MRRWIAAALVALALAAPSRAAFTTLLEPLATAVSADAAKLDGLTDKTSKRNRHTLVLIAQNLNLDRSESVTGDVGILRANAGPLLKILGVAYAPVADALAALTQRVREDAAALGTRTGTIVDAKIQTKVEKLVTKAVAILDGIDAGKPFAQRAAKLQAAAETVESGNKLADVEAKCPKANPPSGHHGSLRATIGDREFSSIYFGASQVFKKGTTIRQRFVLNATREIGGQGDTVAIFFENGAFHGAGTYIVDNTNVIVFYEFPKGTTYVFPDGDRVDITSFDDAARDLRGTFTGTFVRGGAASLPVTDGAFEVCNWADSFTQ